SAGTLRARAFGRVLDYPPLLRELIANLIRSLKLFGLAGSLAFFNELLNFRRNVRLRRHPKPKHRIKMLPSREDAGRFVSRHGSLVRLANEFEYRAKCRANVQIII